LLCKNCCAEKQLFFNAMHLYEVRPRKDHRGVDLISDALPFGRLWYAEPMRSAMQSAMRCTAAGHIAL
jgi:hypothetical protein